ncbi:uncharacterized protein N7459_009663 [Penicillium hispanicum]|uniref:uncharacterized protein n=1 Tax=Penicillium hispanicum TaxID=1080232 RepID=UPI002541A389|nr:uncharacterized protein N7459_009663 [Penicillium hispanicum]KAJ5570233.1 hypothetical protein N7459_009663 [Penicillium hispanicum]
MASPLLRPWLVLNCLLVCLNVCSATNYATKFAWVDSSCARHADELDDAWDEFRALAAEAYWEINANPLSTLARTTMNYLFNPPISSIATLEGNFDRMRMLGRDTLTPYYLYCDASVFVYVSTYTSGENEGKPLPENQRYWYASRAPPGKTISWKSKSATNPCYDEEGRERDAFSYESGGALVLCPGTWEKDATHLCEENAVQTRGTSIDYMATIGSILYHELTHLRLHTDDWAYGYRGCYDLARSDPTKAMDNADSMMYFAIAMLYRKNAWYTGVAGPLPAD